MQCQLCSKLLNHPQKQPHEDGPHEADKCQPMEAFNLNIGQEKCMQRQVRIKLFELYYFLCFIWKKQETNKTSFLSSSFM